MQPNSVERDLLEQDLENIQMMMQSEDNPQFTNRELEQAIRKANMRSAKGPDGITNNLVKTAYEIPQFREYLMQAINNHIIRDGKYPAELKIAKIIPLPKSKPGEYRPISLLPSISKIIEYMIQNRIRGLIEGKLPPHQFGCKPGHSTSQALMRLMHYSGIAAGSESQFGAILYDLTKAYDRVPNHILIRKMTKLKVPSYLINIVYDWISNRTFTVTFRDTESKPRVQKSGILQGSSLSVLLWIMFVHDIPLNPKLVNTYVDDTVGWATGHNKEDVEGRLRYQLKKMLQWCKINKIKINADKTHVIYNEYNPENKIECENTTIKSIESISY